MGKIVKECPEIIDIVKKRKYSLTQLKEDMMNIHGIDSKTADKISSGMKKFIVFFYDINKIVNIEHLLTINKSTKNDDGTTLFVGDKIVFTGVRDKKLEEFIESNGGIISSSVSAQTTLLIHSDDSKNNSSKIVRAKELNVPLISITEFKNKYKM